MGLSSPQTRSTLINKNLINENYIHPQTHAKNLHHHSNFSLVLIQLDVAVAEVAHVEGLESALGLKFVLERHERVSTKLATVGAHHIDVALLHLEVFEEVHHRLLVRHKGHAHQHQSAAPLLLRDVRHVVAAVDGRAAHEIMRHLALQLLGRGQEQLNKALADLLHVHIHGLMRHLPIFKHNLALPAGPASHMRPFNSSRNDRQPNKELADIVFGRSIGQPPEFDDSNPLPEHIHGVGGQLALLNAVSIRKLGHSGLVLLSFVCFVDLHNAVLHFTHVVAGGLAQVSFIVEADLDFARKFALSVVEEGYIVAVDADSAQKFKDFVLARLVGHAPNAQEVAAGGVAEGLWAAAADLV